MVLVQGILDGQGWLSHEIVCFSVLGFMFASVVEDLSRSSQSLLMGNGLFT